MNPKISSPAASITSNWYGIEKRDLAWLTLRPARKSTALVMAVAVLMGYAGFRFAFLGLFLLALNLVAWLMMTRAPSYVYAYGKWGARARQKRRVSFSSDRLWVEAEDGSSSESPLSLLTPCRYPGWLLIFNGPLFYPVPETAFDNPADFDALMDAFTALGKLKQQPPTRAVR